MSDIMGKYFSKYITTTAVDENVLDGLKALCGELF